MEEENKYYTPKIEEFCVGFEFEFETGTEGWKKFQFNKNRATQLLMNVEDFSHQFRVKYLDKEDVESLGWECYDGDMQIYNIQIGFDLYGLYLSNYNMLRITKESNTLFKGEIKNKSELKKLIQQLGI